MSHVLLNIERLIVVLLTAIAFLLALVSFRGLVPVPDPLTPVGYIDRLSLLFGLHEQSHVVIVSSHHWTTEVHTFTFQRRLKDGAHSRVAQFFLQLLRPPAAVFEEEAKGACERRHALSRFALLADEVGGVVQVSWCFPHSA